MSINCPVCQKENRDNAKFCAHCGENFASYTPCTSCHALSKSTKFCTSCGQKLEFVVQKSAASITMSVHAEIATPPPLTDESVRLPELTVKPVGQVVPQVSATVAKLKTPDPESNLNTAPAPAPVPVPEKDIAFVTQEPKLGQDSKPAPKKQDTLNNLDVVPPKSNLKMIVSGVLGAAVLVGGGYWFISKERTPAPSISAITTVPSYAVQAPPVVTPQAAASENPRAESVPSPAIAVISQATATTAALAPTISASSTSSKPADTVSAPLAAIPSKPKTDAQTAKDPSVKKKISDKAIQDTVRSVPAYPATPAQPVVVVPPPLPAPKPVARSIDEVFNSRVASECPQGFTGLLCREKVRFSICDGKWSEQPPTGQTICLVTSTDKNSR